jgi:zinc protease
MRNKIIALKRRAQLTGHLSLPSRCSGLVLAILVVLAFSAFNAQANEVKEIEVNGVKAWVIEDNFLPIISIQIAFKNAGYASDAKEKQGLAYFVSGMLNEGAGKYTSQQFQRDLEENAIEFAPDVDQDNFYISLKTLSDNLDKTLDLTSSALTHAKFGEQEIERVRGQILSSIVKAEENPQEVASRKFSKAYFGEHPYANAKEGELETIKLINAADMQSFVKSAFAKDNMVISIVGDVDDQEAGDIVSALTEGLPEKSAVLPVEEFKAYPAGNLESFKMNNPQTYVMFGSKGVARLDKDYYAAFVLNNILGGSGFQSRLVQEVREKNGLAYSIGTGLQPMKGASLLYGVSSTKNASVDESIKIIKAQFEEISKNGVTEKELADAKAFITGSFGLNLDKNEKLAFFLLSMQIQGLDKDFLEKRNEYINSVTIEQVNKLSKWLLEPSSLVFVRVGM